MKKLISMFVVLLVVVTCHYCNQSKISQLGRDILELQKKELAAQSLNGELIKKENELCSKDRINQVALQNLGMEYSKNIMASGTYVEQKIDNSEVSFSWIDLVASDAVAIDR